MTDLNRIGIDIGGTKMLALAITDREIQQRSPINTGKNFTAAAAQMEIERFISSLPTPPKSIGIAIPGLVDSSGTVIACDVLPQLVGWQPTLALGAICPVNALNDAAAALVQVVWDLQPQTVAAVVMVGTGIGAAISIEGKLLEGAKGWAGELGSIPVGNGKTLDECASGAAILRELGMDVRQVSASLAAGDRETLAAIERGGAALGMGLATLINLLNPEAIVLGGGTLRWQGYLEAALQSAECYSLRDLWQACAISPSLHAEDLVALGAARSCSISCGESIRSIEPF